MKFFVAAVFALLALASADVSHLSKTYLPPVQQSYSGPSYQQSSFSSSGSVGFSAPSNEYLPPVQQTISAPAPSFSGHVQQSYAAPVQSFSAPAAQSHLHTSFTSSGSVGFSGSSGSVGFSAPSSEYLPPVQQTFSAPAPVHQTFSAPAPAVSYSAPAVHSYSGPAVQSYSGPAVQSYSGASHGFSSGSVDVGTQYAANGGYVYRKK